MSDAAQGRFHAALAALPEGSVTGTCGDARYLVTKSEFSGGRSVKLVARELGGRDYVSLNVYYLAQGPRLFPCEMSRAKVTRFVRGFRRDPV